MGRAYEIGEDAVLTYTYDVEGEAEDPTTLQAVVRPPSAASADDELVVPYPDAQWTRTAKGRFKLRVPLTEAGTWKVQVDGTGAAKGSMRRTLIVQSRPVETAFPS